MASGQHITEGSSELEAYLSSVAIGNLILMGAADEASTGFSSEAEKAIEIGKASMSAVSILRCISICFQDVSITLSYPWSSRKQSQAYIFDVSFAGGFSFILVEAKALVEQCGGQLIQQISYRTGSEDEDFVIICLRHIQLI